MSIDLLLINPGGAHGIYGALGDTLVAVEPPLWPRLIAGYLRARGFSVRIFDDEAERTTLDEVVERVRDLDPRLVAICAYGHQPSASTQAMARAGQLARIIRAAEDARRIMLLGGHVAALPERTLCEEEIDFACAGEGPLTILGILKGDRLDDVPDLVFRVGDTIRRGPPAALLPMEALHGDAWDLLPMHLYRAHNWQCFGERIAFRQPYAAIMTSLGCPYTCSFCCINAPFHANRYRMRDPVAVVNEIEALHNRYGVGTFKIIDEMFVLNERHYGAICEEIVNRDLGDRLNIWAYARVDTVRPETLGLLRAAGIRWLALGIESGSKHVRDGASKKLRNEDIVGTVRAIQAAGINVIGNYIFGLRDDDAATMQETLGLALECRTEFANFYSAMAYPGSRLYTEAVTNGWTLPATWAGYSQHNADCRPLDTEHIGGAEVLAFRDKAFDAYFADAGYLEFVERKFGPETLTHVKEMTRYRLRRNLLECASETSTVAFSVADSARA